MPAERLRGALALVLLAAGGGAAEPAAELAFPAPGQERAAGFQRIDQRLAQFGGSSCQAILLDRSRRPSLRLRTPWDDAPLIDGMTAIVWGADWARLADEGRLASMTVEEGAASGAHRVSIAGTGADPALRLEVERSLTATGAAVRVRAVATAPVADCRRAAVEIEPDWRAMQGARLEMTLSDGGVCSLALPERPTADGAYATLFRGPIRGLRVIGAYRLPQAGFSIAGDLDATIEQTGSRLRWHVGARGLPRALSAGDELAFSFALAVEGPPPGAWPSEPATAAVSVDARAEGPRIRPELFGAHLGHIGHGSMGWASRHPWQNDPARDPEAARYMRESGVTFFRAYLHHLFDVLGGCGGSTERDPIAPGPDQPCDYSRADHLVEGLRGAGIELVPCVGLYCPPWLSSRRPSPEHSGLWMVHRAPPTDNARWAAIIAGLVRHWNRERGYGIRLWQVGNEPDDRKRYWVGGTLDEFAGYFAAAVRAMRQADPSIRISGPDLANLYATAWPGHQERWADGFARRCRGLFDDFSWNSYRPDDFTAQVRDLRATLAATGNGTASIWLAEYNRTAGDYDHQAVFTFDGALYLARALASMMANGIDRASYFLWEDGHPLGFFGRSPDGRLVPRPTYHAFRMHAALARLKGGTWLPTVGAGPGLSVLAARHADGGGVSLLAAADRPEQPGVRLSLAVDGMPGLRVEEAWGYAPGGEPTRIEVPAGLSGGRLDAILPPRCLALLVLRAGGAGAP